LSQYATYIAFSWDIVEPITACVTLSDAIAGYFFWLWSGKPWDLNELRGFFFDRKLKKLVKKNEIDYQKYLMLVDSKK